MSADDAAQRTSSVEDEEDKEEYLDEEAWRAKEEDYQSQILALEEEQATLRDAWSDIVRNNLATVDDLRQQLAEQTKRRDDARVQVDALLR